MFATIFHVGVVRHVQDHRNEKMQFEYNIPQFVAQEMTMGISAVIGAAIDVHHFPPVLVFLENLATNVIATITFGISMFRMCTTSHSRHL